MNREVHYEGWLIKSPPTKRIWRARWRRRWFTLKQGEIPEQFCLEYYTDRNCRKLKGVIDLDQCEQVDCGLRLENRKQKFQFMFDIKTPKRTYYLAADTEADMRDWVNCICQVCHLHDTKQSNELQQDENRTQNTATSALTNSTNNTTTTSLNSSSSTAGATAAAAGADSSSGTIQRQSFCNDILRRATSATVVDQQPRSKNPMPTVTYQNNSDCAYVNTEYTNRETVLCDARFDRQQLAAAIVGAPSAQTPPSAAVYLNTSVFQAQSPTPADGNGRLVVSANGVVRKIPESLVLNNTPLPETQAHSVQPSPALSTSSGPYIPISECFSGSPKFILDSNNPTTPLNNLDPKFYDTPRCHNNIGLNLTNDQSYSPKITNCSLQQIATNKNRSHRSDSDSESVFTDDDEWTHPLPLRENVDRSTRPSDSSVENESFVLTYSQRFSKMPDDNGKIPSPVGTAPATGGHPQPGVVANGCSDPLEKLAKVLKNKNNLILDFKENDKLHRDMPQLSDTENTSPAIGPLDSTSVVEESYDIPRSQNLPYYNMAHLFGKSHSPQANPIAASTPNLMAGTSGAAAVAPSAMAGSGAPDSKGGPSSPATVRTLPRQHCYTNAAPSRVEGTVFRYDFVEQSNLPPVNRKLKPKVQSVEDKPPEEVAAKPPVPTAAAAAAQQNSPKILENLTNKLMGANLQSPTGSCASGASGGAGGGENSPLKPPSVDRKLKPYAYKFGASASGSMTMAPSSRRSGGAPLSMVLTNERDTYVLATRTLPRHPPLPIYSNEGGKGNGNGAGASGVTIQHQRTASAAAAMQFTQILQQQQQQHQQQQQQQQQQKPNNEHKLQYFDLDVANPPPINRQSMSVGNLYAAGSHRAGQSMDPFARGHTASGVVYNYVDFVKTEAFKRIREERKKESEGVSGTAGSTSSGGTSTTNK